MNELQDFNTLKADYEQDLPDVFGTVLDTFPNISTPTIHGQIYLWDVLQKIKYNFLQDIDVDTYLLPKYVDGIKNTEYDKRKVELPAICYNAKFYGYKNLNNLKSITNLMFLDIDDFPSKDEAIQFKTEIIAKYDWILACNLSLSKLGLHVIIMVDKIKENNDFNFKYDFIGKEYFNDKLDDTSKSLTRYTVVPYDFNIYINENPKVLEIDKIMNGKGIRSAYIEKKGISSAYKEERILSYNVNVKGISSDYEEKIICTPYPFFTSNNLNFVMNDAARCDKLKFRQEVDESLFHDSNTPIYIPEGIDTISINLYPYRDTCVKDGHRTVFIGAIAAQMIYLNASPNNADSNIRVDILKFLQSINKKLCDPPLAYKEVLNSFNANLKSFDAGELDVSRYLRKQRAFWSKNTILKGNEKRKITCKIKNKPKVTETLRKIADAIEDINASGEKLTQKNVAMLSGLKLPTVKKYRKEYSEMVLKLNSNLLFNISDIKDKNIENHIEEVIIDSALSIDIQVPITISNALNSPVLVKESNIDNHDDTCIEISAPVESEEAKFEIMDEQIHKIFNRIFKSQNNTIEEYQEQESFTKFVSHFHDLNQEDKELLTLNIDDLDYTLGWKQSELCRRLWEFVVI